MRTRVRIALWISSIVPCLLAPLPLFGGDPGEGANPIMLGFCEATTGIERSLARHDAGMALIHARTLRNAAAEMSLLGPQRNGDMLPLFDRYRTSMGTLSSEMVVLAAEGDLTALVRVVEEARRTCISCHARFRINDDRHSFFPARANTITGEVKILKLDGRERTNRSNVVVFLDRVPSVNGFPPPVKNPVISQKNRCFVPRVLPIMKNTTVEFPNDDIIFHNIFSLSKTKPFDLGIYESGETRSVQFSRTGWVKVYCNIHPAMVSNIIILDNPFFALTDDAGIFVIPAVPDGEYTLRAWHEFGREARRRIQVSGSSLHQCDLTIREDKKFASHKNKFGKSYKRKY